MDNASTMAQGYKAVKERSAVVRFKVVGEDAYFLGFPFAVGGPS